MTDFEVSSDAMREIKSRRDEFAARERSAASETEAAAKKARESAGVRAFVDWFGRQRKERSIVMVGESVLEAQEGLRQRFSIGMHQMRYFIAIPMDCSEWFNELPWLHAAISRTSTKLALVCQRTRAPDGTSLPEFALSFDLRNEDLIKMLCNYHYLDVRLLTNPSAADAAGNRKVSVSEAVYMTMDIRVVGGGGAFPTLLDGRIPNGFQNRSVTKPQRR